MYDKNHAEYVSSDFYLTTQIYTNKGLSLDLISGEDFIQKYPMPWTPWCYAYKRTFLLEHNILFEEDVRFEDVDYVMKSTLLAKSMIFRPFDVYRHIDSGDNTSFVGNDKYRIEDLFKISIRMKDVAESFMKINVDAARAAMGHHSYHYNWLLQSLLWRLPYRVIVDFLDKYPPHELYSTKLSLFAHSHSRLYAFVAQIVRPLLLGALWVKKKLKR